MGKIALFLLGGGLASVLFVVYSSLASAKKADHEIQKILKRKKKNNKTIQSNKKNTSNERLELLRTVYPEGTRILIIKIYSQSPFNLNLSATITNIDDNGLISCICDNGTTQLINPEEDIFALVNE